MASPFRTSSPSSANRPSKANGNNSLRKSFNVNVLPKATASRTGSQAPTFTPVNSPADYLQRTSPFKDFNTPAWQSEENVRQCPPKSAPAKSPAPKGMKNFMSPTFSAASKAASPKKRVLGERNESVGLSQIPAKLSSDFANTHFMDLPASREPRAEGTFMKENEEAPRDIMEVDFVRSVAQPEIQTKKDVCRVLHHVPASSTDNDSLSFLSQFPDPGEERTAVLPPYDPKRNYLSPRPDFLRYRPNRGLDIDITEDDEGFRKHGLFKSETPSESGVTETKEIERMDVIGISSESAVSETKEIDSLGERLNAVAIASEALDHRETHKELPEILASDGNSEPNKLETPPESGVTETKGQESLAEGMETGGTSSEVLDHGETHEGLQVKQVSAENPEQNHGLECDSKKNAKVEVEETADDSDEEDEEDHRQGSKWLRTSLLFGFVLLVASVALLSSGSPGLLPPSLHDNGLATGEFYESAADIFQNVVVIWRRDSVKNAGYSLLGYSRTKYENTEKSVKSWFDSSFNNLGLRTQSSMKDGLQNSFENSYTGEVEETGRSLDIGTDVENEIESVTLLSELLVDLKEEQSSEEAGLEALHAILDKDVSQIPSVDASVQKNGQVNTSGDVLLKNPEQPLSSDLLDEESSVEVYGSEDCVASFPSVDDSVQQNGQVNIDDDVLLDNPELLFPFDLQDEEYESEDYPEEFFSFNSDIEEATTADWTIEGSWSEIQSEEAHDVAEHDAEEQNVPEVPETIQISEPAEILSLIIDQDSQIGGEDVLNEQSGPSMVPSDEYQATHASQFENTDTSIAEDIESTISNEPKESSISAGEDSEGPEVQTSAIPRRNPRGLLPIGTTASLTILVASVIAAICFVYTSKTRVKISHETVADKPTVEFFAKKESRKENRAPLERMERTFSPMHFEHTERTFSPMHCSSSRNYPQVQLLAEYRPEEVSSSDKNVSRINAQEKSVQMYERRFRKGNMVSVDTQQDSAVTSEISPDSLSYGSFTTYEKIARKEGGGDKDTKVVTPVRRSNRIRKQATSP